MSPAAAEPTTFKISKNILLSMGAGTFFFLMVASFKGGVIWNERENVLLDHEKRISALEKVPAFMAQMQADLAVVRARLDSQVGVPPVVLSSSSSFPKSGASK